MNSPVPVPKNLPQQIERALEEDIGSGDLTAALIPLGCRGRASVITREKAIICGIPYVNGTFARIDPRVRIEWKIAEGAAALANQCLFEVTGPARALLPGERTAPQFLPLLLGAATATHAHL